MRGAYPWFTEIDVKQNGLSNTLRCKFSVSQRDKSSNTAGARFVIAVAVTLPVLLLEGVNIDGRAGPTPAHTFKKRQDGRRGGAKLTGIVFFPDARNPYEAQRVGLDACRADGEDVHPRSILPEVPEVEHRHDILVRDLPAVPQPVQSQEIRPATAAHRSSARETLASLSLVWLRCFLTHPLDGSSVVAASKAERFRLARCLASPRAHRRASAYGGS